MLGYVVLSWAILRFLLWHAVPCCPVLCYFALSCAMLCYVVNFFSRLCYVVLWCAMLCYGVLC